MQEKKPKYHLNSKAEFIIENYNFAKPFANFFPGIAGKYGVPMWVFYVNRGQAISSFGTKDKDHAIVEFQPANKSWYLVFSLGFRTFIKVSSGKKFSYYEPFHNGIVNADFDLNNRMSITSYDLKIEEVNASLGLETKVEYFNIPQDNYAALLRQVSIKNTSRTVKKLQLLDGLPQVIPYGTSNLFLKKLSRTIEAWMDVENLERGVPFFKLDVDPTDRPQVLHIKGGNFYLPFQHAGNKTKIIKPVVDPECIFGEVNDFSCPRRFLAKENFPYPKDQVAKNKTPCAFMLLDMELAPGEEKTFYSFIGNMRSLAILNSSIDRITSLDYLNKKRQENKAIIEDLQAKIDTASASREFDLYARQTYLDNVMRGGYPITFTQTGKSTRENHSAVFYLYSRKHGDLERDYNKFLIAPTYFSQGNGNYRDINQNRRCDVWFDPAIKDENIVAFLNLIQADGFNPLVVKGAAFVIKDQESLKAALKNIVPEEAFSKLSLFLSKPFSPGELIFFLETNKIKISVSYDEFLNIVIPLAVKIQEADHGEGYWTDHWAYNLDLLESYLNIYPERLKDIVFDKRLFGFYDNAEVVRPRKEKYVLLDGLVKQLHSLTADPAKKEMISKRSECPHSVRTGYGKGGIYFTTLVNKLSCILVNKLASLDPFGTGIEMEANKPNWFDALNGLPALFGSSLCETFELKRLVVFIKDALKLTGVQKVYLSEEIKDFLSNLDNLLKDNLDNRSGDGDFIYWDKSYALKEEYRERTKFGFSGKELEVETGYFISVLDRALLKLEAGIEKGLNKKNNTYNSYFINEVVNYEQPQPDHIRPVKFAQKPLPLFLEGQMHALRLTGDIKAARELYKAVKTSSLYDKALKMYKVTDSLLKMPEEIGRCRVFTPGWLEHESIWLHMEYKYLLEILKQGLYEEFYEEFKNTLVCFQKPQIYGRSILENSSFIVSSAFPDKKLHGNGFVTRLSGSTAEFIHIWLTMNLGDRPFFLNEKKELNLCFEPALAGWLFDRRGQYAFNFLSRTRVIYHNPKRKDTFGKNAAGIKKIIVTGMGGKSTEINSSVIPSPLAGDIRDCKISQIDIYLE